jgi:glycerol-3-phosphate dehydrogenase
MVTLPTSTDVLIVGVGSTGLMLAVELVWRGVDHLLVDEVEAPL